MVVTEARSLAQLMEVPTPVPAPGQIRVRLAAAAVNPVDGKSAFGAYGDGPYPIVPGTDGAGTVDLLGEGVTHFSVTSGTRHRRAVRKAGHGRFSFVDPPTACSGANRAGRRKCCNSSSVIPSCRRIS